MNNQLLHTVHKIAEVLHVQSSSSSNEVMVATKKGMGIICWTFSLIKPADILPATFAGVDTNIQTQGVPASANLIQ